MNLNINIDFNFINEKLNDGNKEGSTFYWGNHEESMMYTQLNFIVDCLKEIKPTTILETGTNKANFVFLVKTIIKDCAIYTFDIDDWCNDKINLVKNYFNVNDIFFIKGDTRQTLFDISLKTIKFDLALVDGGHSYDVATNDLFACSELNVPYILVDDYNMLIEVKKAVDNFIKKTKYKIIKSSLNNNDRGMVLLYNGEN